MGRLRNLPPTLEWVIELEIVKVIYLISIQSI